eukprot:scaffold12.g7962.t1
MGLSMSSSGAGTRLLDACSSGKLPEVNQLLEHNPRLSSYVKMGDGRSPLLVASAAGRLDIVEALCCAAHEATKKPKAKLAQLANQRNGADPTLLDHVHLRTALHYAALHGRARAVEALLDDSVTVQTPAGRQLLRQALLADSQGHHRHVDARAEYGVAPLHLAVASGHLEATRALLRRGASLVARCNTVCLLGTGSSEAWPPYSTPLHLAAASGDERMVWVLLEAAAADPRAEVAELRKFIDYRGMRPFDMALEAGHRSRSLLWMLSPRVPLPLLIPPATVESVPRLAALAAHALRARLGQQLAALAHEAEARAAAPARREAAAGGGPRPASCPASHEGSLHGCGTYVAGAEAAAGAPAAPHPAGPLEGAAPIAGGPRAAVPPLPRPPAGAAPGPATGALPVHKRQRSTGGFSLPRFMLSSAPERIHSEHGGGLGGGARGSAAEAGGSPLDAGLLARECSAHGGVSALHSLRGGQHSGRLALAASVASCSGCPVCLDARVAVSVAGCCHTLCLACAQQLCAPEEAAAPLCPLCRGYMRGFRLLPREYRLYRRNASAMAAL